ncbi:MAG: transporter ATP-binding protein [Candidatus Angelobacter sp.]|nr:transporter ATP-binding protein [Candidatus Angelobacter sp.]
MTKSGSADPVLLVENLTVRFQAPVVEVIAVDHASFGVFPGEVVGVLGESGSGKTTLGSAILGLLPPGGSITGGSIRFAGRELNGLNERELQAIRGAAISTIFQEPRIALNPVMRVGVQVAEVIRAHRAWNSSKCRDEALAMLTEVRLDAEKIYDAFPHELSGGQCQRVAIAQALACRPQVVIADEPTSSLDTTVQADILTLLSELKERRHIAFLLITHNPAILAKFADRILVMHSGKIVEQGLATEVLGRPSHPYTKSLLNSRGQMVHSARASS